jgi:hypothetical protein
MEGTPGVKWKEHYKFGRKGHLGSDRKEARTSADIFQGFEKKPRLPTCCIKQNLFSFRTFLTRNYNALVYKGKQKYFSADKRKKKPPIYRAGHIGSAEGVARSL